MRWSSAILSGVLAVTQVFGATFTNPIRDENGSDPFMVYQDGYYYVSAIA